MRPAAALSAVRQPAAIRPPVAKAPWAPHPAPTARAADGAAAPPSHAAADWGTRHGDGATGGDCASCHTVDACAACHAGQVDGPRPLHPAGYLMLHGVDAQRDGEACASCHGAGTFCAGCHAQAGRVQSLAAPTVSHHPEGWMLPGSPRGHARAARLDLASCATCHGERDCVACHQHVNPHGAAFVAQCGDAMPASSTSCGQCHTLTSPVPMDAVRERCR